MKVSVQTNSKRHFLQSTAAIAHRSTTACHVANICVWPGCFVKWDLEKEVFIGDEEANRLRTRAYRQPHTLTL